MRRMWTWWCSIFLPLHRLNQKSLVFGGRLSDAVDRRKVASPSLLFFSISIGAIALISSLTSLIAVAFAFSITYGLLYPVLTSIVIEKALPNERGKAMAALNATFSIGINFFAFGFGLVAKTFGFELMYVVAGAVAFMGYLIFTYLEAGRSFCPRGGSYWV